MGDTFYMQHIINIKNLAKYEENNRIEAKRAKGGLPNSIWETYSAFANSDGGIILLGVDEQSDHSLVAVGVDDAHKLIGDFWNIVNNRQKVSLNILTERMVAAHDVDGKTVVSIEVPKADRHHKPVYVGTDPMRGTYRRGFEGDYLCTKDEMAAMYRDASDVSLDQKVLPMMDMSAFDMDTVRRYRNRFAQFHSAHIWNDDDDELFLRHIGGIALSDADMTFHPTCAGLLMFGHEYDIVCEYPHYFLDYQERMDPSTRWTDRLVSTSGDWSGNLYDFFFKVYPRLTGDLRIPFRTRGMSREDDTPLHLALREVLLNSLAHSDFYGRQGVVIVKGRDKMTLSNPGDIRIGLKAALAGGMSDPRNETIMKMFSLVDVGERAGSGIPDFISVWTKYMNEKPEYDVLHNPERTQLTLVLPADIADGTQGDTQEKKNVPQDVPQDEKNVPQDVPQDVPQEEVRGVSDAELDLWIESQVKSNPKVTTEMLSALSGKNSKTIKRHIAKMPHIKYVGSGYSGHWEINN